MNHDYTTPILSAEAVTVARHRAEKLDAPTERHRFLNAFQLGRRFAETGADSYAEFRRALDTDDSVTVAGLIEGESSIRKTGCITIPEMVPYQVHPQPAPLVLGDEFRNKKRVRKSRKLTRTQREYLLDAARGMTAEQSAARHDVSVNTVSQGLRNARKRLGAVNTIQAVVVAMSQGQITTYQIEGTKA